MFDIRLDLLLALAGKNDLVSLTKYTYTHGKEIIHSAAVYYTLRYL